jgi:hypothetical protein
MERPQKMKGEARLPVDRASRCDCRGSSCLLSPLGHWEHDIALPPVGVK